MALGAFAAIWEIKTLADETPGNTISATLNYVAKTQPVIVFALGLLGTHLFRDQIEALLLGQACGALEWPLIDKFEESK